MVASMTSTSCDYYLLRLLFSSFGVRRGGEKRIVSLRSSRGACTSCCINTEVSKKKNSALKTPPLKDYDSIIDYCACMVSIFLITH